MDVFSDKSLIATLSAFSLLTLGAGILQNLGKADRTDPKDDPIELKTQ